MIAEKTQNLIDKRIAKLMADGRERSITDVAVRLSIAEGAAEEALDRFKSAGLFSLIRRGGLKIYRYIGK